MSSKQATINVRINASLKDRGDRVLKSFGISTSEAIRALWDFLAQSKELPSFLMEAQSFQRAELQRKKREALDNLARTAPSPVMVTDQELDRLRLQKMMDEYEALR